MNYTTLLCQVYKHFNAESVHLLYACSKEKIVDTIMANDAVQFKLCQLSIDLHEDHAGKLLRMIADLSVTKRFFATYWMEIRKECRKGKQSTHKDYYNNGYGIIHYVCVYHAYTLPQAFGYCIINIDTDLLNITDTLHNKS